MRDYDDDPGEAQWHSDLENDLGYECGKCGHVPTMRELRNGWCVMCQRDETGVPSHG